MSGLQNVSSRVLNMKFMRKAVNEESKNTPELKKTLQKSTEIKSNTVQWSLPGKANLIKLRKSDNSGGKKLYETIGYSQMKDFFDDSEDDEDLRDQENIGRRTFGKIKASTIAPQSPENELTETKIERDTSNFGKLSQEGRNEISNKDDYFLSQLLEQSDKNNGSGHRNYSNQNTQTIPLVDDFLNSNYSGTKRNAENISNDDGVSKKSNKKRKARKNRKTQAQN